ncbi:DNA-directed RNA polymerase III, subunit Rpc31 [Lyophyllum atratum]|nr:DNA-directed RNA polymerase III, subunit Rpc31 [Lyophyllum atratum]
MSRGGGRGGRGGGRGGRGGFGGASALPPMGLSFADIQNLSREATAMYPPRRLPVFTEPTSEEERIADIQIGFATRLRNSQYYVVEKSKTTELPRYSDKYRPSVSAQPTLKRRDLNEAYFPPTIFDSYFNPKKKRKVVEGKIGKPRMNLDEMGDEDEEEKSGEERSDVGSQAAESDYDVDEEYDNDYAENYFDNGENDDMDDLGGGGGDEGGGGDYD